MKYVMILTISAGMALAQPPGNCVVQGRTFAMEDRARTNEIRQQITNTQMALDSARKVYSENHPCLDQAALSITAS